MKLLEFPHSHFCEKARWALDYKGLPFEAVPVLPGFHMMTVRRYAPLTSVPVLLDGSKVVQGSDHIIDYLEASYPQNALAVKAKDLQQEAVALEKKMDKNLGENIRTILYADLLAHPDFLRYCFTHPMPKAKQYLFRMMYPLLRKRIKVGYVISERHVEQAHENFAKAMDDFEKRLNQRDFLVGDQFSRYDIALASLLSFIPMPKQHPFPWIELPDGEAKEFVKSYAQHPVSLWVAEIYKNYR